MSKRHGSEEYEIRRGSVELAVDHNLSLSLLSDSISRFRSNLSSQLYNGTEIDIADWSALLELCPRSSVHQSVLA